jgi:hypothetical protein
VSPHVAITTSLLALEHPDTTDLTESLTEGLIVRHFTSGAINAEEFHYYSAWLLKTSRQRKEAA